MAKRSAKQLPPLIRAIPKKYMDACKNGAEEEKVLIADYRRKFIFQRLSSLVYCWPSSVRHVPYSNGSTWNTEELKLVGLLVCYLHITASQYRYWSSSYRLKGSWKTFHPLCHEKTFDYAPSYLKLIAFFNIFVYTEADYGFYWKVTGLLRTFMKYATQQWLLWTFSLNFFSLICMRAHSKHNNK